MTWNAPRSSSTALRHRDLALAREELARERPLVAHHVGGLPLGDDVAAVHARARPHVHEPVGRAHHLLVVLDHEHGVAEVLEPLEGADQPVVVALVEADRGLVEDVEHADQLGADLGRESQPLRLAARERRGRAVELQVADADVVEEREALADLLHDPVADQLLGLGQPERVEELERARDRHRRELVDRLAADRDREHLRLQPRPVAGRARPEGHVLLDSLALLRGVGLAIAALEARHDPLEGEHVRAAAPHPVSVLDVDLVALGAEQEQALVLLGQLVPGCVHVDLVALGDRLDHRLVEARAADRPGHERAAVERDRAVRDEQVGVDLLLRAETRAARAGAVRRVEREDARLQLGQRDAVVRAGELLGEEHRLAVDDVDRDEPVRERCRRLDRLREARAEVRLHHEPVDHDLDRVLELLVEDDLLLEQPRLTVDLHAREALGADLVEHVAELALAVAHDRRVDRELRPLGQTEHLVDDVLEALAGDRLAADRAMRMADARVQQAQVVVDLGHRADRRARVPRGRLLVDRDRRREPVDRVDVGLLHHLQELARVGGQRLDVAALALGVDRVEGKRRLSRAGEARDADQGVPRQPDGDVLEVVLAGPVDNQLVGSHARGHCTGRTYVRPAGSRRWAGRCASEGETLWLDPPGGLRNRPAPSSQTR